MNNSKRRIAAVGTTAGLALALVGGIAPLAAQADEATPAPTSGDAFDANAQALLASDDAVQAVGTNADGKVVHFERHVGTLSVGHRPGSSGLVDLAPQLEVEG